MATLVTVIAQSGISAKDIREKGALGFPQESATVICDTDELRLSAAADDSYLYLQAVLWSDHENKSGKGVGNSTASDHCTFGLLLAQDGKPAAGDPQYNLNSSEGRLPISFSKSLGGDVISAASAKTGARGKIAFITVDGKKVRVDSIAIPLKELNIRPGATVRVAYFGRSYSPDIRYTSVKVSDAERNEHFDFAHIPRDRFAELKLKKGPELDVSHLEEAK